MWLRTLGVFASGLTLGLLGTLLHRGAQVEAAPATANSPEVVPNIILDEVKLENVPFSKAVPYLAAKAKIDILLNERALDAAAVDMHSPINLDLHHVSLEAALDLMLEKEGGAQTELGYRMVNGVLRISTADALNQNLVTRIYDVKDLVDAEIIRGRLGSGPPPSGWNKDFQYFGTGPAVPTRSLEYEVASNLKSVIEDTIAPDTWRDDGEVGIAKAWAGEFLIIQQTPENQDRIAAFLETMRHPEQTPGVARKLRIPHGSSLDHVLEKLDLSNITFRDAILTLQELTGANIITDDASLTAGGVDYQKDIQLHARSITLKNALSALGARAGGAGALAFEDKGDYIRVSTIKGLSQTVELRVYDVRTLIARKNNAPTSAGFDPTDNLIKMIEDGLEPDTWRESGGAEGECCAFGDKLVVITYPIIQAKVSDFLQQLHNPNGNHN